MTATLTFNLPEDYAEHRLATNVHDIADCVLTVDESMRQWLKYGHNFKTADEAIAAIREGLMPATEICDCLRT